MLAGGIDNPSAKDLQWKRAFAKKKYFVEGLSTSTPLEKRDLAPRWIFFLLVSISGLLAGCSRSPVEPFVLHATLKDIQLVDTHATVNLGFPLLFDQQGNPHVAYTRYDHGEVRYAYRIDGHWTTETAVGNGEYWNGLAMALDSAGEPVLTYQRMLTSCSAQLEMAHRSMGAWSADTIDADGWVGWWTSIQILPSEGIRVSYTAGCPYYNLRYAERINDVWVTTTIDTTKNSGTFPGLAGPNDEGPIILSSTGYVGLRMAKRVQGTWSLETIDPADGYIGGGRAIALDSGSRIHIAYGESGTFKYAVQVTRGTWRCEVIGEGHRADSLVLDTRENPWFASRWGTVFEIGTRKNGNWSVDEISEAGSVDAVTMNRTPDGRIGVAYVTTGDSLFFAWIEP